jgi:hypothetical protein
MKKKGQRIGRVRGRSGKFVRKIGKPKKSKRY